MPAQPEVTPRQSIPDGITKTLIDMTLPATELHVRRTMGLTMGKLNEFEIPLETQFTIEIVLAELLNNIVEHGYAEVATGEIHLKTRVMDGFIEIETRDRGIQMPGLKAPDPPPPDLSVARDDLPEGHFGWFMIRELCDSLEYQRTGEENRLSVKIVQ